MPVVSSVGVTAPELFASAKDDVEPNRVSRARDLSLVDILPAGCSKGDGAEDAIAAALHGIAAMNEMMAIGDNWNDVSMLEVAGMAGGDGERSR